MDVFLLWHVRHARNPDGSVDHLEEDGELWWDEEDGDDPKLLGVYSSEHPARDRIERAKLTAGFSDEPDCFLVDRQVVDRDLWTDGFVTFVH